MQIALAIFLCTLTSIDCVLYTLEPFITKKIHCAFRKLTVGEYMHFYTYDEWVANAYYSVDQNEIPPGSSRTIDVSYTGLDDPYHYLLIRSCWQNPRFVSTYPGPDRDIIPEMETIDFDVGCLWEYNQNYIDSQHLSFRESRGCIQEISNSDETLGNVDVPPYIQLIPRSGVIVNGRGVILPYAYYDNFSDEYKKVLAINVQVCKHQKKRILVFQSIYNGAISFEEANSSLELWFTPSFSPASLPTSSQWGWKSYDYKLRTNLHSDNSIMIAAMMLTFDIFGPNDQTATRFLRIDNLSKFVYGHPDMDKEFDWNLLWETFKPSTTSVPLDSSIMHFTK